MTRSDWSPWGVRLAALAVVLSLFIAGAITGAALYRWAKLDACGDGEPPRPRAPWDMLGPLNLTERQQKDIQAVFDRHKPKLDAVLRETFPKVRAVQEQIDREIAQLLSEEQRQRFESQRKHRGPPPGMPPMEPPGGHERMHLPGRDPSGMDRPRRPPGMDPFGSDAPLPPPPPMPSGL